MRWVQHNTLKYDLLFYKFFENSTATGDNMQLIQSLSCIMQSTTPNSLTLTDYDISNMTLESKGTITKKENWREKKAEQAIPNQ